MTLNQRSNPTPVTIEAPEPTLARAVEDNGAEFLLRLGAAGGGLERRDAEVAWTIGGSPIDYHNAVVRTQLTTDRVDATIAESLALMRRLRVPGTWHVGPSMRPADLGRRLVAAGFTRGGDEPGMAADVRAVPSASELADLTIERVTGAEQLAVWVQTLGSGFGEGPREAEWVGAMYRRVGLGDPDFRHFLARWKGEPAGTVTLFLGAGVGGIYFVMTMPSLRGRGIGAELTRAAMREARIAGMSVAVLASSPMGKPVYERIGFREVCRLEMYEWSPDVDEQ